MADQLEELRDWFRYWGGCVAAVDYAKARSLFADDVTGFGTHVAFVTGLEALECEQWSKVWPNITDFEFLVDDLVGGCSRDMAWAATPWASRGYHPDGTSFDRPGRATVTFRLEAGPRHKQWLGTHTHFSLKPGTPSRTFGNQGAMAR